MKLSLPSILVVGLCPLMLQAQAPSDAVPPRPAPSPVVPGALATPGAVPAPAPAADAVAPIPELERLKFAAGEWVHEKEVDHGGAVGVPKLGSGRSKATWILKGHCFQILYKSKRADTEYEGRGIVSWDSDSRRYRLDWFDNLGHARRFSGDFDPAGALVFSATFSENGQTLKQKLSIKKDRNGRFLILDERALGNGEWTLYVESLAASAPAAPKGTNVTPEPSATTKPTISR